MLALSLMSAPLALLTPVALKIVVDSVLGDKPLPGFMQPLVPEFVTSSKSMILLLAVALVMIVALLAQLREICSLILHAYTGENLVMNFRARLFRHVQRLSLAYHDTKGTADSIYRIQYDALAIQWIMVDGIIPLVTAVVTLVGMICVTALIDRQTGAGRAGHHPPALPDPTDIRPAPAQRLARAEEARELGPWRSCRRCWRDPGRQGVRPGGPRAESGSLARPSETIRASFDCPVTRVASGLLVGLTIAAGTAAVLYIGVRHVQAGALTLGDLLLVMGYLSQLYAPLQTISKKVADLQPSLASAERAFALLDETPEVVEQPNARRSTRARGLSFRDVSFAYDERTSPVLQRRLVRVPPARASASRARPGPARRRW